MSIWPIATLLYRFAVYVLIVYILCAFSWFVSLPRAETHCRLSMTLTLMSSECGHWIVMFTDHAKSRTIYGVIGSITNTTIYHSSVIIHPRMFKHCITTKRHWFFTHLIWRSAPIFDIKCIIKHVLWMLNTPCYYHLIK